MTEWAEGSGSTWESLDGDQRIVAGAEVLLGARREDALYVQSMDQFVGCRARVTSLSNGSQACKTDCDDGLGWNWRVRDIVCLRLASGELTEEGRALEMLGNPGVSNQEIPQRMYDWLERAGIVDRNTGGGWVRFPYHIVDTRLAMALGREEAGQIRGRHADLVVVDDVLRDPVVTEARRDVAAFVNAATAPAADDEICQNCAKRPDCTAKRGPCERWAACPILPPAPAMRSRCGVQPVRAGSPHCADCDQILDDMAPDYTEEPRAPTTPARRTWTRSSRGSGDR